MPSPTWNIYIGNDRVKDIYIGDSLVTGAYIGENCLWTGCDTCIELLTNGDFTSDPDTNGWSGSNHDWVSGGDYVQRDFGGIPWHIEHDDYTFLSTETYLITVTLNTLSGSNNFIEINGNSVMTLSSGFNSTVHSPSSSGKLRLGVSDGGSDMQIDLVTACLQ